MSTVSIMRANNLAKHGYTPVDETSKPRIVAGNSPGQIEIHFPREEDYIIYLDAEAALEIMGVMNSWSIGKPYRGN